MSTVAPERVTFGKDTKLFAGPYGTAESGLAELGLLAEDASLELSQEYRTKTDAFPRVPVAQAIQAQSGKLAAVLREWRKETLLAAFGLYESDIVETAGSDVNVTDEAVTLNANDFGVLAHPIKAGTSPVVTSSDGATTYTEGTDYIVIPRDVEGRTLIYRLVGGTIPASATLAVDYTYVAQTMREYPIGKVGQVRYYTVKLVEDLTNGGRTEVLIHKATFALDGNVAFNSQDSSADLPVAVEAVMDPSLGELLKIREIEP